ncbi:MAG: hypothetical protein C5B47_01785 [Verrucomicrobia bacterium]|nr:MAG: hypothetical protein C5B47_01785 [Verrucomicrobiota bacterium]
MKTRYHTINRKRYSLGELITIVNSCTKNKVESLAALSDLFKSGRVVILSGKTVKRLRLGTC